ncbi:mandelate racemase/muconate lactonizing enzyme family protein [Pedobacter heparinus]|uniref:Dipeptide epimerase n=1 Tax=Pedobacter heparinus (strain ATCC 13125 / DSM 2366 / CIP 104194 / JCM 7457 / NBRC 12017 / NCIMB 9290 / NRRL B-14731 / HIM 762-3) TaxID=485917 RepID=C6XT95_PEDHD|nr:dipeptide epimerase [Pedobacter heparinus]ACU03656.1 Mandelate racemase/muconate lactonizing protein [Pedobacter heparinus DSM 2366]
MKITHTEIYRFSIPMEPFVIATGTMHFAQNVLIRIYTDAGIYGVGECSAFPMIVGETQETCLAMAQDFAKILIGKDPLDIPERMNDLLGYAAHNSTIKSAFDMALFDIAAKNANLPLYQFLGGQKRSIETDMTIGIDTPENMALSALKYQHQGCRIIKIKLGKKIHDDIERVKQIRKAVGDDMVLRLDANQGWSFDDALFALGELAPLNIEFCEQPMRTWYDDKLPELSLNSPIKIMADESCYNHHDARKLINSQSCEYLNIKFSKSGGILEAQKIHETALQAGVKCMIGSMLESRIALSANLHFALASPNVVFFDLDTCLLGHLVDPVLGGLTYDGYFLDVPDTPGIGADADPHFLVGCEQWLI